MKTKPWNAPPSALEAWADRLPTIDAVVDLQIQDEKPRKHSAAAALVVCVYCLMTHRPFKAFAHDKELLSCDGNNLTADEDVYKLMTELNAVVNDIVNIASIIAHEHAVRTLKLEAEYPKEEPTKAEEAEKPASTEATLETTD